MIVINCTYILFKHNLNLFTGEPLYTEKNIKVNEKLEVSEEFQMK